jgi:hypothetical protein
VFSLPVAWQFEQWLNARYLQDLGYGVMCDDLREFEPKMRQFLENTGSYRQNIARGNFLGNELALTRLLEFLPAKAGLKAGGISLPR